MSSALKRPGSPDAEAQPDAKRARLDDGEQAQPDETAPSTAPSSNADGSSGQASTAPETPTPTTSSSNTGGPRSPNPNRSRLPKRKVALCIGYSGTNYQGMQINPGAKTIEEELQRALTAAGAISIENSTSLQKIDWQRCARTDKGVHAAANIVSCKLVIDPPGLIERVNSHLPDDIRVFGYRRTTGSFNAKEACDGRTYEYTMPVYAFAPRLVWPDKSQVINTGRQSDESVTDESGQPVRNTLSLDTEPEIVARLKAPENWSFDEQVHERVNRLLGYYVGTHNFHNFTSGKSPNDSSAKRYITSFTCSKPFDAFGIQYVRIEVKGQSFMLHQIRKMIDNGPDQVIEACFRKEKVNIPMVPGMGLSLQRCHFDSYSRGRGQDREPITFDQERESMEEFKHSHIYANFASQEKMGDVTASWLYVLEKYHLLDYPRIIADAGL